MKHKKHGRIDVKPHSRRAPGPRQARPAPAPGQTDFSPAEEQAMRAGQRQARMAPPDDAVVEDSPVQLLD